MKKFKFYLLAVIIPIAFVACKKDPKDPETPNPPKPPIETNDTLIVSKEKTMRNVLLEEFTGITCVYCPEGHAIAKKLERDNFGKVFIMNIHEGGFADTVGYMAIEKQYEKEGVRVHDLRTNWGKALESQSGLKGYPAASINRHVFPNNTSGTAMSRNLWATNAKEILNQNSYANVGATCTVDWETRELKINVEVYYTDDSPVETNNLNIALLQDSIIGIQAYVDYDAGKGVLSGFYQHDNVLRDLITGQWGEVITTTTKGTLVKKTYTYKIPEKIRTADIPKNTDKLKLLVFLAEGRQEVVTASSVSIK